MACLHPYMNRQVSMGGQACLYGRTGSKVCMGQQVGLHVGQVGLHVRESWSTLKDR